MRKILFVDNDAKEIKRLKKMLRPIRHEWEMEFAVNGEEALGFMAKFPFDVIVSDMHLPGISGVELLDTVMERHPETVRIIHSEHSDRKMVLQSARPAHQFLMKPCNAETMKCTIERVCKLQDLLRSETLRKIVTGIKDLPSLPRLYGLIINEMQLSASSLKKVGHIISQDVSMSAKILQLVNFGLPQKIVDPQQATVYLGIDKLKALVLSIHVFSSFAEDAELCGFSIADVQKHSMMVARLAQDIARAETDDGKVVEEAMIAGMLHDIGKLILLKVPRQYKKVMDIIEKNGCDFVEAEYIVMKTSHAELGAYLLGLWGIPDNVVEAVAFHHNPSKLLENMFIAPNKTPRKVSGKAKGFTTLTAVHMANALMMQENCNSDIIYSPYVDMLYLRTLNLTNKLPEWIDCYNEVIREEV
jgi:putative nucleotidyltransferase with HDIG domain